MTEIRNYEALETRVERQADSTTLYGHAATFNTQSLLLPPERGMARPFYEVIAPGAFRETIESRNVFALVAHDKSKVIGSTQSGTLTLREDQQGLYYEVNLPDTTYARDLAEVCRRGDLTTCSFGFMVEAQEISEGEDGHPVRRLDRVILQEISLGVAVPAYQSTTMMVRSVEDFLRDRARAEKLSRYKKIVTSIHI